MPFDVERLSHWLFGTGAKHAEIDFLILGVFELAQLAADAFRKIKKVNN